MSLASVISRGPPVKALSLAQCLDMCYSRIVFCITTHDLCDHALIEAGAAIDSKNNDGVTALNAACYDRHTKCAMLLVHAGAQSDVVDNFGDTPLMLAQQNEMHEVVALMQA